MESTNNPRRIRQEQLDTLVAAGSVRAVTVERAPDGWAVRLRLGLAGDAVVASHHRPVRIWRHLDTVAAWLQERGVAAFEVRL